MAEIDADAARTIDEVFAAADTNAKAALERMEAGGEEAPAEAAELEQATADAVAEEVAAEPEAATAEKPAAEAQEPQPVIIGGKEYDLTEVEALIAEKDAIETLRGRLEAQVQKNAEAVERFRAEQARLAQTRDEAAAVVSQQEAYADYLAWRENGGTGDLTDYMKERGIQVGQKPAKAAPVADDDKPLTRRELQAMLVAHQAQAAEKHIRSGFDSWVFEEVDRHPELASRRDTFGRSITHLISADLQKLKAQGVKLADLTERDMKALIKQYTAAEAVSEKKRKAADLGKTLDEHAGAKKPLPATAAAGGTLSPVAPKSFKLDHKKMLADAGDDMNKFFSDLADESKRLLEEANKLGRSAR